MEYVDCACKGVELVKTIIEEWKVCFGADKKYTHALEKVARLEATMAVLEQGYERLRRALAIAEDSAATTDDPLAISTTQQYLACLATNVESALLGVREELGATKDYAMSDVKPIEAGIAKGGGRLMAFTKHIVRKLFDKSPIERVEQMMDRVLDRINDAVTIITHANVERVDALLIDLGAREDARAARADAAADEIKKAITTSGYERCIELDDVAIQLAEMHKFTQDSVNCVVGLAKNINVVKTIAAENLSLSQRIYEEVGARYGRTHVRLPPWVKRGPYAYALIVLTAVGAIVQMCGGATLWSRLNGSSDPCGTPDADCIWSIRAVCLISILYGVFTLCVATCEFLWIRFHIDIIVLCLRRWVVFVSTSVVLTVATLFAMKSVMLTAGRVDPFMWLCMMLGYVLAPIGLIRA